MRVRTIFLVSFLIYFGLAGLAAQTFRIGSAAPENSPWGDALNRLAVDWHRVSNGRVRVQVFHNSVAGTESDMVQKMRLGHLQAVVMTNTGLSAFSNKVMTLSMPLLIRDQAEYDAVFVRLRPELDADIGSHGFRILSWSMAGWLYFFSKDPMLTAADLRSSRIAASPEEMMLVRAYQLMGYQAIPIPYTERLAALVNNMANSYLTVPILAAGFQWFGATPNMTNLRVAPAPGAVLMSDRAYRSLPSDIRDELVRVAEQSTRDLNVAIQELEERAVRTMVQYGLTVHDLTPPQQQDWIDELESSYDVMLGTVFQQEFYEKIQRILSEYRRR